MTTATRRVKKFNNMDSVAWKWMRYTGVLMLPLVWGHVLIQDVVVGVHRIDSAWVIQRWSTLFWQAYDILLLGFTFAHGVNGLRQVANDFIHSQRARNILAWVLLVFWAVVTWYGAAALIKIGQENLAAQLG